MNKKGQALVEFIIIIPVFIMLVVALFDFAKIYETKINLETELENYILIDNYISSEEIIEKHNADNEIIYEAKKSVNIQSLFLTPIIGKKYEVVIQRKLYE